MTLRRRFSTSAIVHVGFNARFANGNRVEDRCASHGADEKFKPHGISGVSFFFFSLRLSRLRHARRTRTRPFPARSPRSRFRGTARERPRPAHVRARTRKAHTCVMAFTYTRGVRGSGVLKMHFADKLFDKLPPGTGAGVFRACMYTYNPCDAPRVYSARSLGGMIPTRPPSARPTKLGRFRVVSTCTTAP